MNYYKILEFDKILNMLAEEALSETAKARCLALEPSLNEAETKRRLNETTEAKLILEKAGVPPLTSMAELQKVIGLTEADAMLLPDQIAHVSTFLVACRRMKAYLKRAETTGAGMAFFGGSIIELAEVESEIGRCIRNGAVDDKASDRLNTVRRQADSVSDQIRSKLDTLLRKNKSWFSESFVSVKNGRFTLPVKREHKNDMAGVVVEMSNTGSTCFIEPSSVGKLQSELYALQIEEDSEVRRILYSLTALIEENLQTIRLNIDAMETLDFLFAKAKLSSLMGASPVSLSSERELEIISARHPLLDRKSAVPLDFRAGDDVSGIVITGPNTGGKTVALKTVGLLSLMVQSGLHVPADEKSRFCMRNLVLCDIGDGQSISENLSTFSSHMKNIIEIIRQADDESLVLLDELGSGTDPAEGMGIAVAVLDELCLKGCLFVVTTHYPEIKEYAANKPGVINARMAFDKESLRPMYRLEIGEAGESCALYIAERLGLPERLLERARNAASGIINTPVDIAVQKTEQRGFSSPRIEREKEPEPEASSRSSEFKLGDSVLVYPKKEIGIVYAPSNERGELGVQIKGEKKLINHKRVKLLVSASELYPEDYDFSIVFDTVANRKARHILGKRHEEGNIVIIKEGENE